MAAFCVNRTFDSSEIKLLEHRNAMVNIVAEIADRVVFSADDINWKILSGATNHVRRCYIFHYFDDVVVKPDGTGIAAETIVHILADDVLVAG